MDAKHILTIGIDYKVIHGGVAAVENVYSTFYKPFNHIATVVDYGKFRKLTTFFKAYIQFWYWMLFHKEITIVHVHGASDASFWRKRIFINIAKLFNKKVIFHCHGAEFKRFSNQHKKSVSLTLKKCDCIIALSESWKAWFEEFFHHNNVIVVKNVINEPHENKIKHDKFVLLFLGRLGKRKGIYDLLNVVTSHKFEFKDKLKLILGGDGDIDKIAEIIRKNELNDIVQYKGWVNGKDKIDLLNYADAYILPSYNEGLPISILEAMSYSLPIISTNVGGIPEILEQNKNGFIMNPGDKDSLYYAIHELMNKPDLCKYMGLSSRTKVKEHLPTYVEQKLSEIYLNILNI